MIRRGSSGVDQNCMEVARVFFSVLFPVLIYSKTEKGKRKEKKRPSTVRPGKSEPAPKAWGSPNSRLAEMKGEKEGRM